MALTQNYSKTTTLPKVQSNSKLEPLKSFANQSNEEVIYLFKFFYKF